MYESNLHILSSLFLYGFSIKAKRKATLGYQKWVSLQYILPDFPWKHAIFQHLQQPPPPPQKKSCASGTVVSTSERP